MKCDPTESLLWTYPIEWCVAYSRMSRHRASLSRDAWYDNSTAQDGLPKSRPMNQDHQNAVYIYDWWTQPVGLVTSNE